MYKPTLAVSLCFVATCITLGCSKAEKQIATESISITGAGATFPAPLYLKWIDEYERQFPHVKIDYDVVGSGEGIKRFFSGSVDFGASDAALSEEQIRNIDRGVVFIPCTAGSIAIAYHPDLPEGLRFSRTTLVDIFLGKINRWNDARVVAENPDINLPDRPMQIVVRDDSSGTTYAFSNHLAATSEEWKNGPGVSTTIYDPKGALRTRKCRSGQPHQSDSPFVGLCRIGCGETRWIANGFARKQGWRFH